MTSSESTAASLLAEFAVGHSWGAVPNDVAARATGRLLDTLGCGFAAVGLGAGASASVIAIEQGGNPEASILGQATRLPVALAALANGTRCHSLDFDDTHEAGICHASTVVLPAALAVAEARGSTGEELLAAYALGCEVALRIAVPVADGLYERGLHPTPICGAFGAAAAAARLARLDATTATNALGIVGSFAAGLFEYLSDGSETKPLHAGWAAQSGVQAVRLAAAGATGPATVIEGRFGLVASHTGRQPEVEEVCEGLGKSWQIEGVSIKGYPACHFVHSPTWAAAELVREHRLGLDSIQRIYVRIPDEGIPVVLDPLEDKLEPRTVYDAKFSLPFTVAHLLVQGSLGLRSFTQETIADREVLALAAKVSPEQLDESERGASRFSGGVRIVTNDGRSFSSFLPHAPGSPANPLTDAWLEAKFTANASFALETSSVERLLTELRDIGSVTSLELVAGSMRTSAIGDESL